MLANSNSVLKIRWKGENVATTEVADHLLMIDCIEEANVYGVKVPGKMLINNHHISETHDGLLIPINILFVNT